MKRLLSICIPTFNRANLLEGCLASVLPQLADCQQQVECIVSDNACTDQTSSILDLYQKRYPFLKVARNQINIGIIGNITRCAVELAEGEFVWIVGDDDVLTAGCVQRIVAVLSNEACPDLAVLNVAYLPASQRPALSDLEGGVRLSPNVRLLRDPQLTGTVEFAKLFSSPPADLTAAYSVIIGRQLWRSQFPQACSERPFSSIKTTYPSAFVIAKTMAGKPVTVIDQPSIAIYEMPGEQFSWAKYRGLTTMLRLSQLLQLYRQAGVPQQQLDNYYRYSLVHRSQELSDWLWNPQSAGTTRDVLQYLWLQRRFPLLLLRTLVISLDHPRAPRWLSWLPRSLQKKKPTS